MKSWGYMYKRSLSTLLYNLLKCIFFYHKISGPDTQLIKIRCTKAYYCMGKLKITVEKFSYQSSNFADVMSSPRSIKQN